MPIDAPVFVNEQIFDLIVTSDAYCINSGNALDSDPTTYASFIEPAPTINYNSVSSGGTLGEDTTPIIDISPEMNIGETAFLFAQYENELIDTMATPVASGNLIDFQLIGFLQLSADEPVSMFLWTAFVSGNASGQTVTCQDNPTSEGVYLSLFSVGNVTEVTLIGTNTSIIPTNAPTVSGAVVANNSIPMAFFGIVEATEENSVTAGNGFTLIVNSPTVVTVIEGANSVYEKGAMVTAPISLELAQLAYGAFLVAVSFIPSTRYLESQFPFPAFISRVRLLQKGPGVTFAGLSFFNVFNPEEQIPLPYVPLPIDGEPQPPSADSYQVSELTLNPPVNAEGIIYLPDAYNFTGTYQEVDLYQLQVYYATGECMTTPNLATTRQVRNGVQQLMVFPYVSGLPYPFAGSPSSILKGLQTFSKTTTNGVAVETGGESPADLNGFVFSQEVKLKVTNEEQDLYYEFLMYNGAFQVVIASAGQPEQQYMNMSYYDFTTNPESYMTIVAVATRGNGTLITVAPKCLMDGGGTFELTRNKITDFDAEFRAFWDSAYPTMNGGLGCVIEEYYINGPLQSWNPS